MEVLLGLIEVAIGFVLCVALVGAIGKLAALFFKHNDR